MPHTSTASQDATALEAAVRAALNPTILQLADDSAHHEGHPEAHLRGGRHYKLTLVSTVFERLSRLERERLVHTAVQVLWAAGRIHALSCRLYTPTEWAARHHTT
jgi:BolA family transcriptional regulator, general stress-responsive regulator